MGGDILVRLGLVLGVDSVVRARVGGGFERMLYCSSSAWLVASIARGHLEASSALYCCITGGLLTVLAIFGVWFLQCCLW